MSTRYCGLCWKQPLIYTWFSMADRHVCVCGACERKLRTTWPVIRWRYASTEFFAKVVFKALDDGFLHKPTKTTYCAFCWIEDPLCEHWYTLQKRSACVCGSCNYLLRRDWRRYDFDERQEQFKAWLFQALDDDVMKNTRLVYCPYKDCNFCGGGRKLQKYRYCNRELMICKPCQFIFQRDHLKLEDYYEDPDKMWLQFLFSSLDKRGWPAMNYRI